MTGTATTAGAGLGTSNDVAADLLPLTHASIDAITAIADPAVRNLWITQSYADIGSRLGAYLANDHSWCTFAVWASNTAGESIRGQELPAFMDELLGGAHHHLHSVVGAANGHTGWLRWTGLVELLDVTHIDALARSAINDVAEHIAHGNTLVYGELAPLFVSLLDHLESDAPTAALDDGSSTTPDAILDGFGVPTEHDEPLVRNAFRHYLAAVHETDETTRSQLVLAANISAVLHEQQRLQPDIAASLNACIVRVEDLVRRACHRLLPSAAVERLVDATIARATPPIEGLWAHIATEMMMTLATPQEVLVLHRDVPRLPDGACFPATLAAVDFEPLATLLGDWDTSDGMLRGSGAGDWAILHQRMGYIVNLFRSRQQSPALGRPPFDAQDLDAMRTLRLPSRFTS